MKKKLQQLGVLVLSAFIFYCLIAALKWGLGVPHYVLPHLKDVFQAFVKERQLLIHAACVTGVQSLIGFLLAGGIGFLIASILAYYNWMKQLVYPWVMVLQMIPIAVLAPLVVLWVGPGMRGICCISFLISFFPIVVNTTFGMLSIKESMVELFQSLGASRYQTLVHLKIPNSLPYFLQGLKIAGTLAPIGAITGDVFLGSSTGGGGGLGFLVVTYYAQMKIPALYAVVLATCILGFSFMILVYGVSWKLLYPWHESWRKNKSL